MAIVVVGGHTRNIGKTGVMAAVIAALPEFAWTAIKITQFGHGVCSANGEPCDCETADHTIAISEERSAVSGKDTSRYLAAGARKSFWVRTRQGQLAEAMPRVRKLIAESGNVIVESNSVLRFLKPDLALFVADGRVFDFKPSALRYLDRVDALVAVGEASFAGPWEGVSPALTARKPRFTVDESSFMGEELREFVFARLLLREAEV
jgi:molybdopterin-guanine dinucleotide biosynthesis protein